MQIRVTVSLYQQTQEEYKRIETVKKEIYHFSEYEAILYLKQFYTAKLLKSEFIILITTDHGTYALWKDRIRFFTPNTYQDILTQKDIRSIFSYQQIKRRDLDKQLKER